MGVGVVATRRRVGGGRLPDPAEPPSGIPSDQRIREDVRDGLYVMLFSCGASTATALSFVLLVRLAG